MILLTVNEELLFALLVLKTNLIKPHSSLARIALDGGFGFFVRQRVRRYIGTVQHTPRNDGPIRIALNKFNQHLMPDSWEENAAPFLASPSLRNAHPARTLLVRFAVAI